MSIIMPRSVNMNYLNTSHTFMTIISSHLLAIIHRLHSSTSKREYTWMGGSGRLVGVDWRLDAFPYIVFLDSAWTSGSSSRPRANRIPSLRSSLFCYWSTILVPRATTSTTCRPTVCSVIVSSSI